MTLPGSLDNARTALDTAAVEAAALLADLQAKAVLLAQREETIAGQQTTIGVQTARISALEEDNARLIALLETDPEPVPDPPSSSFSLLLGACPMSKQPLSSVVSKWGRNPTRKVAGRPFDSDEWSPFTRPAVVDMPMIVASFKPRDVLSFDELIAVGDTLTESRDVLVTWHENDVKFLKGDYSQAQMDAYREMQAVHTERVRELRADGKVRFRTGEVYGGWRLMQAGTVKAMDKFIPRVTGDVFCLDLDGTPDKASGTYEDWSSTQKMGEARRLHDRYYPGKPIVVTEYSWGGIRDDTNRARRTAAITLQVPRILAALPEIEAFIVFDFENYPGEPFLLANEIGAVKAAVPA